MNNDIDDRMTTITDNPNFIKELEIRNFKSIKYTKLDNGRINVFIGEPNTGKSNILEALGVLSAIGHRDTLKNFIRITNYDYLHYNEFLDKMVSISIKRNDDLYDIVDIKYTSGNHIIRINESDKGKLFNEPESKRHSETEQYYGSSSFSHTRPDQNYEEIHYFKDQDKNFNSIKYYKFRDFNVKNLHQKDPIELNKKNNSEEYYRNQNSKLYDKIVLHPPKGENIYFVVNFSSKNQLVAKDLFNEFDMKLHLLKSTERVEAQKDIKGVVKSYPLYLLADTVQSLLFYYMAVTSNENSVIVLEEPESHTFPTHTRDLALKIAEDQHNQYFIATHNPYFLNALIEKAKDIQINFVRFKNDQTEVIQLNDKELNFLIKRDIFVALTHYDDWPKELKEN